MHLFIWYILCSSLPYDSIIIFHELLPPFGDLRALNRGETRFRYGQRSVPLNFDEGRRDALIFPTLQFNQWPSTVREGRCNETGSRTSDGNANVIRPSVQSEIRLSWSGNFRFWESTLSLRSTRQRRLNSNEFSVS